MRKVARIVATGAGHEGEKDFFDNAQIPLCFASLMLWRGNFDIFLHSRQAERFESS